MAKLKKRSVAPIYAIAVVWVIFTLIHPLYRVSDYVSAILLSAVAFVVAKGIWPTVEYELPDPEPAEEVPKGEPREEPAEEASEAEEPKGEEEPASTGDPTLDALIQEKDRAISEMRRLNDAIADETISAQIDDAPHMTLLIVIFLAPFVEEVLFRGLVFGNLKSRSRALAYVVSCLLFALLHVWQFAVVKQDVTYFLLMIQYLVPGLVLAWAYDHSGTLWASIGLHAAVNALSVWAML